MTISIYIHIPFCLSKCNYCTFNSYPVKNFKKDSIKKYVEILVKQLPQYKGNNFKIETIYFGGGTPSLIDEILIEKILDSVILNFNLKKNCEITIEVNPESINYKKIIHYRKIGINRISLGIQTFNDRLLKILGRPNTSIQILKAIEIAKKHFENVSFDLIFGIPSQKIDHLFYDLEHIKKFSPTHISYYVLSVEKGSNFYKKGIKEIEENKFNEMYDIILDFLEDNNFFQYEISNFSKKGYECKHNLRYWNYKEYLGLGAGAVSFLNRKRWKNVSDPVEFIKNPEKKEYIENLDKKTMEFEYIFLNLRKKDGINLNDFKIKFKCDFLKKYSMVISKFKNYFTFNNYCISLNREGFKVSNYILSEFLT